MTTGGLKLLTREAFSTGVLTRDRHTCVACGDSAVDAHHLLERRLFQGDAERGGYFLDNGVSVCGRCHLLAETTDLSVEDLRHRAGISTNILPEHFEPDDRLDKWGNQILPNGTRLRGELFFEEAVQKALRAHLDLFTHYVKAPKTYHLPWSPGLTNGDKVLVSLSPFVGKRVIATKKMDGENNTLYRDHLHARSLDGRHHPSRDWLRQFHAGIAPDIPEFWRVTGEGMYARHSIAYENLRSWFLGFGVWNERNINLAWDETLEWFSLLGIEPVEVIYDGIFDEAKIRRLHEQLDLDRDEGFVLRVADSFSYRDYRTHVGKYVRVAHVQTDQHWMQGPVIRNGLITDKK